MRLKKLISIILSGIMAASALGSLTANAEENSENKKIYKLSELFAMSKEDFFALRAPGNGNHSMEAEYKNNLKAYYGDGYSVSLSTGVQINDGKYKPYYTEKTIMDLLDTDLNGYKLGIVVSPLITLYSPPYSNFIVSICDENVNYVDISEENCLKITKFQYCLNQILPDLHLLVEPEGGLPQLIGDPNGDEKLDIIDAAFIARNVACKKTDELDVEQADFNNDGNVDILDAASIAQFVALRYGAKYLFK